MMRTTCFFYNVKRRYGSMERELIIPIHTEPAALFLQRLHQILQKEEIWKLP